MVRAWRQARRFDARRAQFTTWLYRIILNRCIDERRRSRPEVRQDPVDQVDPSVTAEEMMDLAGRQMALASALRDLPPRQRAALTLVYDEGMSGAEAAQVLGLSNKAVERLLARGRAYLRQRLQQTPLAQRGSKPC
jgi:RNA polymerase sigma-70 factor (ECF subfamily)